MKDGRADEVGEEQAGLSYHIVSGQLGVGKTTQRLIVLYLIAKELYVSMDALVDEQPRDWPPDSELVYMKLFADCTEREYAILVSLVQYVKVLLRRSM